MNEIILNTKYTVGDRIVIRAHLINQLINIFIRNREIPQSIEEIVDATGNQYMIAPTIKAIIVKEDKYLYSIKLDSDENHTISEEEIFLFDVLEEEVEKTIVLIRETLDMIGKETVRKFNKG